MRCAREIRAFRGRSEFAGKHDALGMRGPEAGMVSEEAIELLKQILG
jgi:hypothetical protein